jgi:branched-chain amino acid transport system permease protein
MKTRGWVLLALSIVMAAVPPVLQSPYLLVIFIFIGLNTLLSLGLSLTIGYAGQLSLAHAAFYGLGAYATGIATTKLGLSPWLGLVIAVLVAAAASYVLGRLVLPLGGDYLAMATLAFQLVVYIVFVEASDVTGGQAGLTGVPPLEIGSFAFDSEFRYFYIVWAAVGVALLLSLNLVDSRPGRALQALRDSPLGAEASGIDTARYKVAIFMIGGAFAGLAGGLYAHLVLFVNPSPFTYVLTIAICTMAVVGGLANIWGAVLGAAVITALGEILRTVISTVAGGASGEYEIIAFGLILVLVMLFKPEGLAEPLIRGLGRLARFGRLARSRTTR